MKFPSEQVKKIIAFDNISDSLTAHPYLTTALLTIGASYIYRIISGKPGGSPVESSATVVPMVDVAGH
jgi:hypothetical protein